MIALQTRAIDGGVQLTLGDAEGALELRLGWRAARRLSRDIATAMTLDPPWAPLGEVWADQMLEIGEQGIGKAKGAGCEPLNEGFIRVLGAGLDVSAVLDAPMAVFASDDEPHNRFLAANPAFNLDDRSWVPVEGAVELSHRRQDGPVSSGTEILIAAAAVIRNHDEETVVTGHAEASETDDSEPRVGASSRRPPLDGDMTGPEPGQNDRDHLIRSCSVMRAGVDAESGPGETSAPAESGEVRS